MAPRRDVTPVTIGGDCHHRQPVWLRFIHERKEVTHESGPSKGEDCPEEHPVCN